MIEKFFEGIKGLVKEDSKIKYNEKEVGKISDEYITLPPFIETIQITGNLPNEIIRTLSKKGYFLIFERDHGCC